MRQISEDYRRLWVHGAPPPWCELRSNVPVRGWLPSVPKDVQHALQFDHYNEALTFCVELVSWCSLKHERLGVTRLAVASIAWPISFLAFAHAGE